METNHKWEISYHLETTSTYQPLRENWNIRDINHIPRGNPPCHLHTFAILGKLGNISRVQTRKLKTTKRNKNVSRGDLEKRGGALYNLRKFKTLRNDQWGIKMYIQKSFQQTRCKMKEKDASKRIEIIPTYTKINPITRGVYMQRRLSGMRYWVDI